MPIEAKPERVARRFLAVTTPLPASFPKDEIGLMEAQEFLDFSNPTNHWGEVVNFYSDFDLKYFNTGNGGLESRRPDSSFKYVVQNVRKDGEHLQVRALSNPKRPISNDRYPRTPLVVFNSEGQRVAVARGSQEYRGPKFGSQPETMLLVAREYRGKGLGNLLSKLWYKYNPDWKSGGYSEGGFRVAMKRWKNRVREFLSRGWYSELVKQGRLDPKRLKVILDSYDDSKSIPASRERPLRF